MKILLTGATGFLGKALQKGLVKSGIDVQTLIQANGDRVDLTSMDAVRVAMAGREFDVLVHLAGYAFVQRSNPVEFYRVNVLGTENLIEAMLEFGQGQAGVLCTSTAGVYGQQAASQLHEDLVPQPLNHYSISKYGMEQLLRKYSGDRQITVVRPFNIIGSGQSPLFLVPKLVNHFARRSALIDIGNLEPIRDYVAVEDFVEIMVSLATRPLRNSTINIGTGQGYSVRDVIDRLASLSGHLPELRQVHQHVRKDDISRLVADPSHLRSSVEFVREFTPLEQVLANLLEEYKE